MDDSALPGDFEGLLVGVNRLVRRRLRRGVPEPRLRGAQVELLRLVGARPGLRVSEAAEELRLAGNSVSTLVRQLIGLGMLTREPDPQDGRAALLRVTPAAAGRLRAWEERRAALLREQLDRLSEEDRASLAAALPALRRLAANLHDEEAAR
ncbi:MarR family winged helix-turn-helix transcriptional regulator [Kitasatospora indigofera]|uniref:MarR family winged helix-turn-helix transcriptional regulator n=1 Tax=Kitasatospora indigofera TaxID=67307 RepID=UPI0036986324